MLLLEPTGGIIFQALVPVHWLSLSFYGLRYRGLCAFVCACVLCIHVCDGVPVCLPLSPSLTPRCISNPLLIRHLPVLWVSADLHAAACGGQRLMIVLVIRMDLRGAKAGAGIRGHV